jgi:hypothetical protein
MPKSKDKKDDAAQSDAFIKKAKEIGADADKSNADLLMGRLAKMKPEPRSKKKTPGTSKVEPGFSKKGARSTH